MDAAKEEAKELVNSFKSHVSGYVGSSMLTNTEYPEQILKTAKTCAHIAVDYALQSADRIGIEMHLEDVKSEIDKITE